ncbi:transposase [Kaistella anthropi]|nr:transposase [Kaistella anthropi]
MTPENISANNYSVSFYYIDNGFEGTIKTDIKALYTNYNDKGINFQIKFYNYDELEELYDDIGYMAAFLRQIKIRVLTLTSRKSNEKIKIYGAADIEGAPKPARRQKSGRDRREFGISEQTFYNWKSKYGGMTLSELQRVKELEAENARLKRIVADQQISIDILKEVNSKKW